MKIISFLVWSMILFALAGACVFAIVALDYFTGTKDLVLVLPLSALTALTLILVFTFRRTRIKQSSEISESGVPVFTDLGRDLRNRTNRENNVLEDDIKSSANDAGGDGELFAEPPANAANEPPAQSPQTPNRSAQGPNTSAPRHSITLSVIRRKSDTVNSKF